MTVVSVVYHSAQGHNRLMAESVHDGAAAVDGVEVRLLAVEGEHIKLGKWSHPGTMEALEGSDAIIFGCPTHMGSVSAEMKAFLDATLEPWRTRAWVDKVAAGFTVSSTPSGDKLHALNAMFVCAMQLGMIWVGLEQTVINREGLNRLSIYVGAGGQADYTKGEVAVHEADLRTGALLGERVARVTGHLLAGRS